MSKLRLSITMSLDGYVAGSHQGKENPLGVGGMELHEWAFPLKEFREMHGEQGGETNASSSVVQERRANIGATIMGRNMFGGGTGPWEDDAWPGWWGEDPPYHHPVFVLTHHTREPLEMKGGTTFHFVTDGIEAALAQAKNAAQGQDIWFAGGGTVINSVPGCRPRQRDRHLYRAHDHGRRRAPVRRAPARGSQANADPGGRRTRHHTHQVRRRLNHYRARGSQTGRED